VNSLSKLVTSRAFLDNVGLKGASILLDNKLAILMLENQGCFMMSRIPSFVPILCFGSLTRHYRKIISRKIGYLSDKIFTLVGHVDVMTLRVREIYGLALNKLVHLGVIVISRVEWRETNNHLVRQHTYSPPVHWERMTFLVEDLRGQIIWCSTETESLSILFKHFSEAKICKANVAVLFHKNILGF
jgi:hypothetical protein